MGKAVQAVGYINFDSVNRSEIARTTGYTLGHISRVFSRKRRPSWECAAGICQALGTTMDEFWEWYMRV